MIDILKFVVRLVAAGSCSVLLLWALLVAYDFWIPGSMGLAHSYAPVFIVLAGTCFFYWALGFIKLFAFRFGRDSTDG